ncbi:unnamed protein product [Phytomonas sp. Hart1]|nr:unnamed protein product [Phytomonas sp. Hart1]|eukprot:CCW67482.1 unnamed protein product [Phytomonas sp. isolate Hart1]
MRGEVRALQGLGVDPEKVPWGLAEVLPTGCVLLDLGLRLLFEDLPPVDRGEVGEGLAREMDRIHRMLVQEDAAFLEYFDMDLTASSVDTKGEIGLYDNRVLDRVLRETNQPPPPLNASHSKWSIYSDDRSFSNRTPSGDLSTPLIGIGLNSDGYLSKMLAACDMLSSVFASLDTKRETDFSSLDDVESFHAILPRMRRALRVVIGRRYIMAPHPYNWSELDLHRAYPFLEPLTISLSIRKRFVVLVVGPPDQTNESDSRRPAMVGTNSFLTLAMLFPGLTPSILYAEEPPSDPQTTTRAPSRIYFPCKQQGIHQNHDTYLRLTSGDVSKIKELTTNYAHQRVVLGLVCTENATVADVFPLEDWYHKVFPLVLRA